MDLLERINNCSEEELNSVVEEAIRSAVEKSDSKERLGFPDGAVTFKIPPHKGFISPDTRIKFSNYTMNSYSMKTTDYFYEFAKFIRDSHTKNKGNLVKVVENFINWYFGITRGGDLRDNIFDKIAFETTTTDDEYFEKLDALEIGDLKAQNVAMCTERAAVAQNLLSLFGFDVYYCMGCVNHNGVDEAHCYNIARAKDKFMLLDYSLPAPVIDQDKVCDYAPFQGTIGLEEIEDVLTNGVNKPFPEYQYVKTPEGIKRVPTGNMRTYTVGNLSFEHKQSKSM